MKLKHLHLHAHFRAICIMLALFLVPNIVQAYDVYLLTRQTINGTTGKYEVPSNHKFTQSSGTVYTYTINSIQADGTFSFRIGVGGWENNLQPYNNDDPLTINGSSYTITDKCYGHSNAWKVSYKDGEYSSLTITVDISNDANKRYVKITGVKSSSGGGSSTTGDESADDKDTESKTAGYGVPDKFGGVILRYNSSTAPTAGNLFDLKDYFSVAYLTPDSKGYKSTFAPYFNYLIKDVASHADVEDGWNGYVVSMSQSTHPLSLTAYGNPKFLIGNWSNSTSWTVGSELNYTKPYLDKINSSYAGMLDFPLHTFIYNIEQGKYSDASAKGWQALTYLSQIAPTNTNRASVVGSGRNSDALYNRLGVTFVNNDKINDITGDENIKKAYAVILTSPGTPVVNYSDLTNSDLNDNILRLIKIRHWAGVKNTSAFMTSEDKNYNNAYDYHIQGDFAELKVVVGDEAYVANYEKNGNNGETTGGKDDRNNAKFGGDGYNYTLLDEGTGWRVWYRNNNNANAIHVALSPESGYKTGTVNCTGQVIGIPGSGERKFAYTTDGTAPVLGASNTKTVTYTWNSTTQSGKVDDFSSTHATVVANGGYVTVIAQAIKDGALIGALDTVTYRFNDYVPLNVKLTPKTATVAYGASLTPKVEVTETDATTRTYAYTLNGTVPVIDTATGKAGNDDTKVVTYTYDEVIPSNDLGTFYMAPGNVLTFIDNKGTTSMLTGNKVTVKAQAVQTVTEGSKYRLEGNIATGNYTFETAGVQPGANYKIAIVNENKTNYPSINKAVLDVTVINEATNKDDGVDVYYTLDGSDPWNSNTARLVRDRKVTVYGYEIPQNTSSGNFSQGYIRVAINNKTYNGTTFDITYSTSEGGYVNYQSNSAGKKTIGGDDKVVVYVKPVSPNKTYTVGKNETRIPFIYAYERVKEGDEYVAKSLTTSHQILSSDGNTWGDWRYFVLEPATGYKDINVTMGYKENDAYTTTDATVANVCKDVFLEFNVETGQIKDVTHENTNDFFYTTGNDGTKIETANPKKNDKPFIYVQVPSTWVSNGNSVKVLNGTSELSATVAVQPAAQTSDFSNVCKITLNNAPDDNTELTIQPYNEKSTSSVSFKIKYQNGGYYYYESDRHYSATAPLVFGQYSDNNTDKREYTGYYDPNHLKEVGNGDKTNILNKEWTYSPEPSSSKTTTADDNWTGSSATVNVIPAGTTISQKVTGLTAGTPYTVQMIVRGKSGATGKLSLNEAKDGTATDSKSFTGYDAAGTITTDGRVEALLSGTSNGWQKLEATANASAEGKLTISLAATGAEMELSDVTLLENANTKGHVWTTVPTNSTTTEYFLTDDKHSDEIGTTKDSFDRYYANSFSFFDRGVNYNAVVYVSDKTAVGMSANTYNIAVPITTTDRPAKAYSPRRAPETAIDGDSEAAYTGQKLALYDNTGSWTNDHTWDATENVKWDSFSYDRNFYGTNRGNGTRNTICLPFAMTSDQITSIFGEGAKIYEISSIDESALSVVYGTAVTETQANTPYILEISNDKDGVSMSGSVISVSTPTTLSSVIGSSSVKYPSQLVGVYSYTNIQKKEDGNYRYYGYDAEKNGIFNFFKKTGADFKPFRAYLEVSKSTSSSAKAFYYFKVKDSTTDINTVDAEASLSDNAPVYNLQGQIVRKAGEKTALPKGIFIQNGRKFIQK